MSQLRRWLATLVLLAGQLAIVHAQSPSERAAQLAKDLTGLRETLKSLPAIPKGSRSLMPLPDMAALSLTRAAQQTSKLYDDLPESVEFLLIEARSRLHSGDAGRAILLLDRVAERTTDTRQRADALALAAEARGTHGAYGEALRTVTTLEEQFPGDPRKSEWSTSKERWLDAFERQEKDLDLLRTKLRSQDQRDRIAGLQVGARFATSAPLHPESGKILALLIEELGDASPADTLGYHERLSLYCPEHGRWMKSAVFAAERLHFEGEYERAAQHIQNLLDRSQELDAKDVGRFTGLLEDAYARVKRVQARRLEVKPATKSTRLADLERRLARGSEPEEDLQLLGEFAEDYPGASELPDLRFSLGRSLLATAPAEAVRILEGLLSDDRSKARAGEILELIVPRVEETSGAEDAEMLLARHLSKVTEATRRVGLTLEAVRLLGELDRLEEAEKLLVGVENLAAESGRSADVAQALEDVRARLGR